jgi:hypothetical protein
MAKSRLEWQNGELIPYEQLMEALPRVGIVSVNLSNCYTSGALKESVLERVPAGTLLQTLTGENTVEIVRFLSVCFYCIIFEACVLKTLLEEGRRKSSDDKAR